MKEEFIKLDKNLDKILDKYFKVTNNLKRNGYISLILNLKTKDKKYIIKFNNESNTSICNIALNLDLYNREIYFYEVISKYIKDINIPKYISTIRNDDFKPIGIIIEDVSDNHIINLDLNTIDISVILKLIKNISKLHNQFINKPIENTFKYLNKNNKQ